LHNTKMEAMENALSALGLRLSVNIEAA
ncbi:transcriptional regulator, partial [Escherichia coli]